MGSIVTVGAKPGGASIGRSPAVGSGIGSVLSYACADGAAASADAGSAGDWPEPGRSLNQAVDICASISLIFFSVRSRSPVLAG